MSKNKRGEESAHPTSEANRYEYETGLSKREHFAAMAMQGLIAGCLSGNNSGFTVQGNVLAAVEYADALLAELDKEST